MITFQDFAEDIHVIRQNLTRLVHHFASSERSSESDHRHGQRHTFVPRKTQWAVRSADSPRLWGPFDYKEEAWNYIRETINFESTEGIRCEFLAGSEEEGFATFEDIGKYTIEPFYKP